jgi:general secretion pathway protein G
MNPVKIPDTSARKRESSNRSAFGAMDCPLRVHFVPRFRGNDGRREGGFTLIELLVVLVILGLLAGLVGPKVLGYLGSSRTKTAHLQIEQLSAALDLYKLDTGAYPDSNQGLQALVTAPPGAAGWHGPYLGKGAVPNDPWGHPYHYRMPGQHGEFDIWSLGSDNQEGGEGEAQDVTSW